MSRLFCPHSWEIKDAIAHFSERKQVDDGCKRRPRKRRPANDEQPAFMTSIHSIESRGMYPHYFRYCQLLQREIPGDRRFDWGSIPYSCTVEGGRLPRDRVNRKRVQIENLLELSMIFINYLLEVKRLKDISVVEFCAGSGFVILPLAARFPNVSFVLVDRKETSVEIGRARIREASLDNVHIYTGDVRSYKGMFHLGIALHACGNASDLSLQACISSSAAFIICPCCIGKILFERRNGLSMAYQNCLTENNFKHLVKAGDFGHSLQELISHGNIMSMNRRKAKSYIEEDRRLYATENGYISYITSMCPSGATPKDDILIGWPVSCRNRLSGLSKNPLSNSHLNIFDEFDPDIFDRHLCHLYE